MSMDNKKNPQNDASSSYQLMMLGALGLLVFSGKIKEAIHRFYIDHYLVINSLLWIAIVSAILFGGIWIWNKFAEKSQDDGITEQDDDAVFLGEEVKTDKAVALKQSFRTMHAQVIGTTNAGKTESVILPMAIQDIKNGSGVLIIDGKSDSDFLDKLYAYAKKYDRAGDFKMFSLVNVPCSSSFNPLRGNTPQEVTERVFSSFKFESEYYKNIQYRVFLSIVRLIFSHNEVPTFALVYKLLTDTEELNRWVENCKEEPLTKELARFLKLTEKEREERTSGLETMISHFISAEVAPLFQETDESIDFAEALAEGQILYFQIPTMLFPIMGEATGKLILQAFQSAISRRQVEKGKNSKDTGRFFSCILDDFQDYIYEGFGSLLNKSRSANVGVVFSHQALGDLDKVSEAFKNVVLTNTNIKVIMRMNDPDTCDHFAKTFGTKTTTKMTEKTKNAKATGDGTIREVEQFNFHPNEFKNLGTGFGIVSLPHRDGVKNLKIKFSMRPNLKTYELKKVRKKQREIEFKTLKKAETQDQPSNTFLKKE
ncbi:MAG: TraM recognition domain-containing protein [Bdellovibrionaceae bacterium]|nr:TraM recognition domain-containing protein [Pseudobdellovibrionaceae bacterium]